MAVGKVKWFNDSKGYGFIERLFDSISTEAQLEEVFVHYSAIIGSGHKTLRPGQEVEFDLYEGPKGRQAQNVTPRA